LLLDAGSGDSEGTDELTDDLKLDSDNGDKDSAETDGELLLEDDGGATGLDLENELEL